MPIPLNDNYRDGGGPAQPVVIVNATLPPAAAGSGTSVVVAGPLGSRAAAESVSAALPNEQVALLGSLTEAAPATDTASSGQNGRLQRIAQRLTSLIALLPGSLGAKARAVSFAVTLSTEDQALLTAAATPATQAISAASLPLPTGAATSALQGGGMPAALGQTTMANSLAVVVASNQSAVPTSVADGGNVTLGTTTGAAVVTDANGTAQQYLRGLVKLWASVLFDATNQLRVSLYGKSSAAGDTPLLMSALGHAKVNFVRSSDGLEYGLTNGAADSNSASAAGLVTVPYTLVFNNSTWDRLRNNETQTTAASAARTATLTGSAQTSYNGRGVILLVNITARAVATTLTPSLQLQDPISGNYFTIWTAAAAINSSSGTFAYAIYPSTLSAASWTEVVQACLARVFRVVITASDSNSVTYSVGTVVLL